MIKRCWVSVLLLLTVGLGQEQRILASEEDGWVQLFDGKSLRGWKAGDDPQSFKVVDGLIVANGPRAHLFYVGDEPKADFKNFELEAEVLTSPGANSGIYFHTQYQRTGWPDKGFEVQINNTYKGEGDYRELKKTGSLYGIRNQYKTVVHDNEWFRIRIRVEGKEIRVWVNDWLLVDFVQPEKSVLEGDFAGRVVGHGTFALQCHDPGSKVFFRNFRVKPLPDPMERSKIDAPKADETYLQILQLQRDNFPVIDFHVHLKGGLTLEESLAESRRTGINYGIAVNCGVGFPITDDKGAEEFLRMMKDQPVFVGMQAVGQEWRTLFSAETVARFDYVFTDAMVFTDDAGKRVRLWINEEVDIPDKQAFMDMYVNLIVSILNHEPIDIYVNPTFLPECIAKEYDQLWTAERMQKVIDAARKNDVAIEINARYRIPSLQFIRRAKAAGVKFSMGTNNADRSLGRLEYCLEVVKSCGLTWQDMFMPKPEGQKLVQRRGMGR